NTGLGIWTEDMFLKAVKTGKHMATSRDIQPPMPWQGLGKATDEDLRAIFAYLRSIPPVTNHVPDYEPPAAPPAPEKAAPKKK
ncbi:MAG TPA: diheme cytochrome c-553, partial [Thermoanaerobaculia bacterium]|nr:diheme cytochrome c-553 [Thermoanaerobaculia bacterium]